jgi:hypothetical protein
MTRRGWQSVARIAAVIGGLLVAAELLSGANASTGVPPTTVSLSTFAGNWGGHDRGLVIGRTGVGFEQVNSGCCPPSFKMTFRIYRPRHTPRGAGATLRVTAVYAPKGRYAVRRPLPHVGQTTTITLRHGVLVEPLTGNNYCDGAAQSVGKCGA